MVVEYHHSATGVSGEHLDPANGADRLIRNCLSGEPSKKLPGYRRRSLQLTGYRYPERRSRSATAKVKKSGLSAVGNSPPCGVLVSYPCVVKPCSCGSSVGVSIVNNEEELKAALDFAKRYETKILIEDMICGREFSVGILNGKALPAIEIRPKDGFYDYERKYQSGLTDEICPAELSESDAKRLAETALKAHRALNLGSYSRIDFIREEKTGKFMCLEANTLPGMTPMSLLPQEAAAEGIDYDALCLAIAMSAIPSK